MEKIKINLNELNLKLVAEENTENGYKEICIFLEKDGLIYQDIARVTAYEEDQTVSVKVYNDVSDEDFTHEFIIDNYDDINRDRVEFNGVEYDIAEIEINTEDEWERVWIAGEDLLEVIIDKRCGLPVNLEAENIDCQIYFYVPNDILKLSSKEIAKFIKENS